MIYDRIFPVFLLFRIVYRPCMVVNHRPGLKAVLTLYTRIECRIFPPGLWLEKVEQSDGSVAWIGRRCTLNSSLDHSGRNIHVSIVDMGFFFENVVSRRVLDWTPP
jgi:hypothetical protein